MEDAALLSGASAPRLSPRPDVLTADELRQRVFILYVLERLSGPKTAAAVGIGSTTVYEVLEQLGLQRRSQRAAQAPVPIDVEDDAALVLEDGTPNWVSIGRAVRCARSSRRLSQRQLAPLVGADRTSIEKIENGRQVPSLKLAHRIAVALGVEFSSLFPEPPACARCGERASFEAHCQGHGPKAEGPVATRRDRKTAEGPGETIRLARIACGLTLEELAAQCSSSAQRISIVESGQDVPSAALAASLAQVLRLSQPFAMEPCKCGKCGRFVIGDRYAHGCAPLPAESKKQLSAVKLDWWAAPEQGPWRDWLSAKTQHEWLIANGPLVDGLLQAASDGRSPIPIHSETRRRLHGSWSGRNGGRPTVHRTISASVIADVRRYHDRDWGRRTIRAHTGLSEHAIREILKSET